MSTLRRADVDDDRQLQGGHRMKLHANAALSLKKRRAAVRMRLVAVAGGLSKETAMRP
jgi:hypothetical protein